MKTKCKKCAKYVAGKFNNGAYHFSCCGSNWSRTAHRQPIKDTSFIERILGMNKKTCSRCGSSSYAVKIKNGQTRYQCQNPKCLNYD